MAATNSTVNVGEFGAYEITLTAATVDKVTFNYRCNYVEITNHSASDFVYARFDGTDPASAAATTVVVPPQTIRTVDVRQVDPTQSNTEVRLISAGTPKYSVARGTLG